MHLHRLILPITISIAALAIFIISLGEGKIVSAAPLSQDVITTTFDFDNGSEGWQNFSHAQWQSSVACWDDVYTGHVCTSDFGLPPYEGVMQNDGGTDGSVYDADIYLPRMVSADGLEVIVHRSTQEYWSFWIWVYTRTTSTGAWGLEYQKVAPLPAYSPTWPDARYSRVRLCFKVGGCPDWGIDTGSPLYHPLTGSYQIRVKVGQVDQKWQNVGAFIDEVSFVNCMGCPNGGWGDCETVDNPDFDDTSAWTLSGSASISDSVLSLSTGDSAQQDFLVKSNFYTATVIAQRISTDIGDGLIVALNVDGHIAASIPVSISATADGQFHEVEIIVEPDVTGDGTLIVSSNGSYQVDYICLEAGGTSTCTSENRIFDFEDGYIAEGGYGYSQHWRGMEYPHSLGDYPGIPSWINPPALDGHFETIRSFSSRVAATIKYDYMVVPHLITVTSTVNPPGGTYVDILTSPDGETWSIADHKEFYSSQTDIITFALNFISPVYVAVAQLGDIGLPFPVNMAIINQVEMEACYSGPNTFTDCIVGDPDFDIADGYPSRFYWDGYYTAVPGAAALDQSGFVAQHLTPPWAGRYNLEIVASSTEIPCSWNVQFTNYGSAVGVAEARVQCMPYSEQTYNVLFDLPGSPLTLWIEQITGQSSISRVCLTPAEGPGRCLNINPDLLGATGYTGDWYDAGSRVTIPNDGKLAAVGVEYQRADPPYELELIVAPAITDTQADLTINQGNIPGSASDETHTITETSYITYSLASEISGNFGPTLWNLGDGDLSILRYCLRAITGTTPIDPFWCVTVQNPDFIDGLQSWDYSNVLAFNGIASFATDAYVSQGLGNLTSENTNATVRWLTDGYASTVATLTVVSDAGTFNQSHNISPGNPRFYEDVGTISGTTTISVSTINSGLELDFICLYPGDTAPPLPPDDEGGVEIPPGGELAECIAPPMGILPNITQTLISLWPWGGTMTNFEVLMAYNTGWVRFIGCRLDYFVSWMEDVFWGEPWRFGFGGKGLRAKLDQIIFLLAALNFLAAIQALLTLLQTIGIAIDSILENLLDIGRAVLYIIGVVGLALLALVGLLMLLAAIIAFLWSLPQEFWTSFRGATTGDTAVTLPLPTDPGDPLYNITIGLQIANQVIGGPIAFTITVLAIAIGSIVILLWTIRKFSEAL